LGPFDCITLWHSLEHVRDPSAILRDCKKILKPGGVLLIAVPDAGGLEARTFGARWFHLDVPRHLFHFTRKSLASVLRAAGFAGLRSWHQEFEYDLLGWSQSALNAMGFPPNLFFHADGPQIERGESGGRGELGLGRRVFRAGVAARSLGGAAWPGRNADRRREA